MESMWAFYGISPLADYFSAENKTSVAALWAFESQKLFLHDDIGNGQLLGEGDFEWVAREGTDIDLYNGDGVHIEKEVVKEFGFNAGENATLINATFEFASLSPFVDESGIVTVPWQLVSNILCHEGECAATVGAAASPTKRMVANFTATNFEYLNLSWWDTRSLDGTDLFEVLVNNNSGSGEVSVYSSTTDTVDEYQSVLLPSSMWNATTVSIIFEFTGNNLNNDFIFADDIGVSGNASISTAANVTVFDGSLQFGDKRCGFNVSAEDGYNDLNITCDNINLIGNVTSTSVTELAINVTSNITLNGTTISDWGSVVDSALFPSYILANGTTPLTGNWATGGYNITGIDWLSASLGNFTSDLRVNEGTLYSIDLITPTGKGISINGSNASVGSAGGLFNLKSSNGGNGVNTAFSTGSTGGLFEISSGAGGNSNSTGGIPASGDGGQGGSFTLSSGDGGDVLGTQAAFGNNAGNAGIFLLSGGDGGDSQLSGGSPNIAGDGGGAEFAGGNGGDASNGGTNTGGEGGNARISGGDGGNGDTQADGGDVILDSGTGGTNGKVFIRIAGADALEVNENRDFDFNLGDLFDIGNITANNLTAYNANFTGTANFTIFNRTNRLNNLIFREDCDNDMVARWAFDYPGRRAEDTYGNNDGDFTSSYDGNRKVGPTSGFFDGSDTMTIPDSDDLDLDDSDGFRIEFWFYGDDSPPISTNIINKTNYWIDWDAWIINATVGTTSLNSTVLDREVWHHVALTRDSFGTLDLFINGVIVDSASGVSAPSASSADLIMGDNFRGKLDEVAIFNHQDVISTAQLQTKVTKDYTKSNIGNHYCMPNNLWDFINDSLQYSGDVKVDGNMNISEALQDFDGNQFVKNNTDGGYNFSMKSSYDWMTTGNGTVNELTLTSPSSQDYKFIDGFNKLGIQGQTSGQSTEIRLYNKDGDATDNVRYMAYGKGDPSQNTNYERIYMGWDASNSVYRIKAEEAGTGTPRNLYIGTDTSADTLQLRDSSDAVVRISAKDDEEAILQMYSDDDGASTADRVRLRVSTLGSFYFEKFNTGSWVSSWYTTSTSHLNPTIRDRTISASSNVYISGSSGTMYRSTSSERFKKDIEDLPVSEIDKFDQLMPKTWKAKVPDEELGDKTYYGFTAEQVESVYPQCANYLYNITYDENGDINSSIKTEQLEGYDTNCVLAHVVGSLKEGNFYDDDIQDSLHFEEDRVYVNNSLIAKHYVTNTTKDLETMQKINDLYAIISGKSVAEIKDFILNNEGKLSDHVLYSCKSEYGSYDIACLSHYLASSQVFMMKKISQVEDKQQQQLDCWDLTTQTEIRDCMRSIN